MVREVVIGAQGGHGGHAAVIAALVEAHVGVRSLVLRPTGLAVELMLPLLLLKVQCWFVCQFRLVRGPDSSKILIRYEFGLCVLCLLDHLDRY